MLIFFGLKIERLKIQAAEKEAELLKLLEKTPKDLWNADLDHFLQEWEVGENVKFYGIFTNYFYRKTAFCLKKRRVRVHLARK